MSIVSSTSTVGHAQANGKKRVVETHTDHLGNVYRIEYGPIDVDSVDINAIRTARAAAIELQLAEEEARRLIEGED